MEYFDIEKNLLIAIDDGKSVELISSRIDENIEKQLRLVIERILERYGKSAMYDTLFSCIVELATNGTKANMKHLFFKDLNIDIHNPEEYYRQLKVFKERMTDRQWVQEHSIKARELGFYVKIAFHHNSDGITIEVINNLPLLDEDEKRIRHKFSSAMKYDDIISFYNDHHDSTEGEGLGFALNVILMKAENIDPALFRIGNLKGQTVARIEIPLTAHFKSLRKKDLDA